MNQPPSLPSSLFAQHDCERLPDRAWLEQLSTEIRAIDAEEGLLVPLQEEDLIEPVRPRETRTLPEATEFGVAWLSDIGRRTWPPKPESADPDAAATEAQEPPLVSETFDGGTLADETPDVVDSPALLRARQSTREGDLRGALTAYASLLPQGPGLTRAAEDLAALSRVQPRNGEILQLLGDLQYALAHWEDACVSYQRALTLLAQETV